MNLDKITAEASTQRYPDHTVGGKLHRLMTDNGLWPNEADAVLASMKTDERAEQFRDILTHSWDGYPKQLHAVVWLVVKRMVVEYIDNNKPRHFARSMFAE